VSTDDALRCLEADPKACADEDVCESCGYCLRHADQANLEGEGGVFRLLGQGVRPVLKVVQCST